MKIISLYNLIMINNTKIEICIGNIDDAITASKYPIDRIELNSALELGGLTPSLNTVKTLKEKIDTPLCCMVRPRGGDFVYTDIEFETMLLDAKLLLENGADGIVFGFIKDGKVDIDRTSKMVELIHSYNRQAIFHKAFDEIEDLDEALNTLVNLHIDRVLTGGGQDSDHIVIGATIIGKLQSKYGDKIELLPGGGVRIHNIQDVITNANSHQIHMTSKKTKNGYICLDEQQLQELLNKI